MRNTRHPPRQTRKAVLRRYVKAPRKILLGLEHNSQVSISYSARSARKPVPEQPSNPSNLSTTTSVKTYDLGNHKNKVRRIVSAGLTYYGLMLFTLNHRSKGDLLGFGKNDPQISYVK